MPDEQSIDFLKKKYNLAPSRKSKKHPRYVLKIVGVFLILLASAGILFSYQVAGSAPEDINTSNNFSIFSSFKKLVTSSDKNLPGEKDDKVNFLLLGIGGAGHEGPELTDTIIFGSFKPSSSTVGLLSIPRDLIVQIPGYGYRKINAANAYGETEKKGNGMKLSSQVISQLLDEEIPYTIKIDFKGFEQLIDAIGGIDIYVDRTFSDYKYPTEDYLVETITFEQGPLHLNGETALKFARSRHGTNGEGSDFARAARQQKILVAVKEKVLSPSTLLNPGKLNKIIQTFQDNVDTNMTVWEMTKMAKYAPSIKTENIRLTVLDDGPNSPLYSTNINGAYVLMPKKDDWSQIQEIADNVFDAKIFAQPSIKAINKQDTVKIEIQNGTSLTGLAYQTAQLLDGSGFEVTKINNAESRGYKKTIIYDLTNGKKTKELAILKDFFEADVEMSTTGWVYSDEVVPRKLSITTPGEEYKSSNEPIDFLVILGETAQTLVLK